jgi:hypothetical protein
MKSNRPTRPWASRSPPRLQSATLDLLLDDRVQPRTNLIDVHSLGQRPLLLDAVHHAFKNVRGIEARRERAWREILGIGGVIPSGTYVAGQLSNASLNCTAIDLIGTLT